MRAVLALLAVLALTSCSAQDDAVVAAVRDVGRALESGDGDAACALLAPLTREELEQSEGRPCAQALADQDLVQPDEVARVERYGRQSSAVVRSADGEQDTWFLSRFGGRWLLVAASCRPRGDLPYACDVEGA